MKRVTERLTSIAVLRTVFVASALVALVTTALVDTPSGHTIDGAAGPVSVSVTPNEWLADGQTVVVHAESPAEVELFEIKARVCQADAGVNNTFEFSFDGPFCAAVPVSPGADADRAMRPDDRHRGDLEFKVGAGTASWTTHSPVDPPEGAARTLTCGQGAHCDLVVQLQITNGTVFYAAPLLIGEGTVAAPPPPADTGAPPVAAPAAADGAAPPAAGATGGPGGSGAAGGKRAVAAGGAKGGADGAAQAGGDGPGDSSVALNSTPALASAPRDAVTRGVRVFSGGIAGLVGGALIVLIVMRARRRSTFVAA